MDLGLYQNSIEELPTLELESYERIFKIFKQSIEDKDFYTYNILKKIEFPELDSRYIQFYTPTKRMALTILSYNIYNDIKSWWILYLLNKDKFEGAPFFVESGTQIKYITDLFRTSVYSDITNSTVFSGRHY